MPQLDFSTFASQIFWLVVFSVLLYFGLKFFFFPKINKLFDERNANISGALKAAEQAKKEAEQLEQDYRENILSAKKNASLMIDQVNIEMSNENASKKKELEMEFDKKLKESQKKIINSKQLIIDDLLPEIGNTIQLAIKHLINVKLSQEEIESQTAKCKKLLRERI